MDFDFAELEVVTGATSSAARRVAELMSDERLTGHQRLLERARLVKARTDAAHGANDQALAGFESVVEDADDSFSMGRSSRRSKSPPTSRDG